MKKHLAPLVVAAILAAGAAWADSKPHWSYSGPDGPSHWTDHWPDCGGSRQSPVDITRVTIDPPLGTVQFSYRDFKPTITNNGHTIQVSGDKMGEAYSSFDSTSSSTWNLLQFHFHAPSEHTIGGQHHEMELHLVHALAGDPNQLLVVGVMMERSDVPPGIPTFDLLTKNMPQKEGEVTLGSVMNAGQLLPPTASFETSLDRAYYTYPGSLTTPPCSQIVTWVVLRDLRRAPEFMVAFEALYDHTNRPVQSLNARLVKAER